MIQSKYSKFGISWECENDDLACHSIDTCPLTTKDWNEIAIETVINTLDFFGIRSKMDYNRLLKGDQYFQNKVNERLWYYYNISLINHGSIICNKH